MAAQFHNQQLQDRMEVHQYFKMLSQTDIKNAAAQGICFQSHGVNHELFHALQDDDAVKFELVNSKKKLEQLTGKKINWIAYANGDDKQPNLADHLKENGYSLGFSLGHRPVKPTDSPLFIPRYEQKNDVQFLF